MGSGPGTTRARDALRGVLAGLVVVGVLGGLSSLPVLVAASGPADADPRALTPGSTTRDAPVEDLRRALYRSVFRAAPDPGPRPAPGGTTAPVPQPGAEPGTAPDPTAGAGPPPQDGAGPVPAAAGPLAALLASRPADRVPDPALTTTALDAPGEVHALRADDGSYLMVWTSQGAPFTVDTTVLGGRTLQGWWFDPRTGTAIDVGEMRRDPAVELYPPVTGPQDEGWDWVLVVDDATAVVAPPGGAPPGAAPRTTPPGPLG